MDIVAYINSVKQSFKYSRIEIIPTRRIKELYPKVCFESISTIVTMLYLAWVPATITPLAISHKINLGVLKGKRNLKTYHGLCYVDINLIEVSNKLPISRLFMCIIHEFRHWYQDRYFDVYFTPENITSMLSHENYTNLPEEKDADSLEQIFDILYANYINLKELNTSAKAFTKYNPN